MTLSVVEILEQMCGINKPQRKFLTALFVTILVARGRINFYNLSRYSCYSEKTYRRQFRKTFDYLKFNLLCADKVIEKESVLLLVQDPSFIPKSGKKTFGLGKFFNSCVGKAQRGLEISTLALVDVRMNTAYSLSAKQTPSSLSSDETRLDFYLSHLQEVVPHILKRVGYAVMDGYFAKQKFVAGVSDLGLEMIGKLRFDANLRYLYKGARSGKPGRPKKYDGKVSFTDLTRFEKVKYEEEGVEVYTLVVNHISLKRDVRIVIIERKLKDGKTKRAILFSTDTCLEAEEIIKYYKSRFQIEFLFRDAKQFTGLTDCQSRNKETLEFHFNAALTATNLARVEAQLQSEKRTRQVYSIASQKQRYFNEQYLNLIISKLEIEPQMIKNHPDYESLRNYGAIAA